MKKKTICVLLAASLAAMSLVGCGSSSSSSEEVTENETEVVEEVETTSLEFNVAYGTSMLTLGGTVADLVGDTYTIVIPEEEAETEETEEATEEADVIVNDEAVAVEAETEDTTDAEEAEAAEDTTTTEATEAEATEDAEEEAAAEDEVFTMAVEAGEMVTADFADEEGNIITVIAYNESEETVDIMDCTAVAVSGSGISAVDTEGWILAEAGMTYDELVAAIGAEADEVDEIEVANAGLDDEITDVAEETEDTTEAEETAEAEVTDGEETTENAEAVDETAEEAADAETTEGAEVTDDPEAVDVEEEEAVTVTRYTFSDEAGTVLVVIMSNDETPVVTEVQVYTSLYAEITG